MVPGKVNNALRLDNQQCVTLTLNQTYDGDDDERGVIGGFRGSSSRGGSDKWCLFDVSDCSHGFYISLWMKIRDNLTPRISIAVSSSISIVYFKSENLMTSHYYKLNDPISNFLKQLLASLKRRQHPAAEEDSHTGVLVFDFTHVQGHAYCVVSNVQADSWLYVEASWRQQQGLRVYLDRYLECTSAIYRTTENDYRRVSNNNKNNNKNNKNNNNQHDTMNKFVFGCSLDDNEVNDYTLSSSSSSSSNNNVASNERKSGKVFLDWVEIFFRDRKYLLAHDHLLRGSVFQISNFYSFF